MPITINGTGSIAGLSAGGLPNSCVNEATLTASAIALTAPTGAVSYVLQSTAPAGWLKANGAAVSRTTYANLFAAISTTFGAGDGSTTFNLPDLRGEFVRGWADDRAVDTGRAFGSAQADELKSHQHDLGWTIAANVSTITSSRYYITAGSSQTGLTGGTETRPRNIALLAIVKY